MRTWKMLRIGLWTVVLMGAMEGSAAAQCSCNSANPNDNNDDACHINMCLASGGTVALERGSPGYILEHGLDIVVNGTRLTSVDEEKVLFIAKSTLEDTMLRADEVDDFVLENLIFDGRKDLRQDVAAEFCEGYRGLYTSNLRLIGSGFELDHVDSINAVCGSALEVAGSNFEIHSGFFANNGHPAGTSGWGAEPWADGITITLCDGGYIHNNDVVDNTDIGIVVGQGENCSILWNAIEQVDTYVFVGLHIGAFQQSIAHTGALYQFNQIDSAQDKMSVGLMVGDHPWEESEYITDSGETLENEINGAVVSLSIDGIEDGVVLDNELYNDQGSAGLFGCTYSGPYTAYDFGITATIQGGYASRWYHNGTCGT